MSAVVVNCLTAQKQNSSQRQLRANLSLDNVQFFTFCFCNFHKRRDFIAYWLFTSVCLIPLCS